MSLAHASLLGQSSALCRFKTRHRIFRSSKICCTAQHRDDIVTTDASVPVNRRTILTGSTAMSMASLLAGNRPAYANIVQDLAKGFVRPDLASEEAAVVMMDARGTLYELKDLARTPADSQERVEARRLLPGMAKRLREVGMAAPVLTALIKGTQKESVVSEMYGGNGGERAATDEVYSAIGNIVTISGRTIRKEAQASPELAASAIRKIEDLLASLPKDVVDKANELRAQRRAVAV
ncbi:g9445 [Coccomyxa elongata]